MIIILQLSLLNARYLLVEVEKSPPRSMARSVRGPTDGGLLTNVAPPGHPDFPGEYYPGYYYGKTNAKQ